MKKIFILLGLVGLISGCVSININENSKQVNPAGRIYYSKANIWYLNPENISSHNFHTGLFIPVGTKVKILDCSKRGIIGLIRFSDESNKVYTMILTRNSQIDLAEFFKRYFSEENVMATIGNFHKLTDQEQANIKNGKIDYGMSKEAVLASYGYPPPGRDWTPDIKNNIWEYFENTKIIRTKVYFEDDRAIKIEGLKFGFNRPFMNRGVKVTVKENKIQANIVGQNNSNIDEIRRYKELMDDGIITKVEFEQKKKQLLGIF